MRILVGVVLPGSPIADPISDQKYHFPHPFSDLEEVAKPTYMFAETEIISSLPRLCANQRFLKIHREFGYYGFISYSFGANRQICSITPPLDDKKIQCQPRGRLLALHFRWTEL